MASEWAASFPQWPKRDRRGVYRVREVAPAPAASPSQPLGAYVARKVMPHLHVEGHNAANFRGDLLDMMRSVHINGRDRFMLHRILEKPLKPSEAAPDGLEIDLDDRDWRCFQTIRSHFIRARDARIAQANAGLIAARQTSSS